MDPAISEFLAKAPLAAVLMGAIFVLYRDWKAEKKQTTTDIATLQGNFIAMAKEMQATFNAALREVSTECSTRLKDQRADFAQTLKEERENHTEQIALIQHAKRKPDPC